MMEREVAESETNGPRLADLRAFCRVVDLASLTAAAHLLGETKGTISRRITRLEASVGVQLLRRSARVVGPTEDGLAYRARVGRALELLDEASADLSTDRAAARGTIRLTAPPDLAGALVAPLIAEFGALHPHITFELLLTERVVDLEAQRIDLALRVAEKLPDSNLLAQRVVALSMILVASPRYLDFAAPLREPDELAQHRLLMMGAARREVTIALRRGKAGRPARVKLRPVLVATDLSFTRALAIAGGGVAMQPEILMTHDLASGTLRRVLPEWFIAGPQLHVVHPSRRLLVARVKVFRDWLVERLRGSASLSPRHVRP